MTGYLDYVTALPAGGQRRANVEMLIEKAIAFENKAVKGTYSPAQCKARKLCDVKAPQQSKCPAYNSHNTAP